MQMKLVIFSIEGLFAREEWNVEARKTEEEMKRDIAAEWNVDPETVKIAAILED